MRIVSEEQLEELAARTGRSLLVEPVEGVVLAIWVNRRGDIRLTRIAKPVTLNIQVATGEGRGPENGA